MVRGLLLVKKSMIPETLVVRNSKRNTAASMWAPEKDTQVVQYGHIHHVVAQSYRKLVCVVFCVRQINVAVWLEHVPHWWSLCPASG